MEFVLSQNDKTTPTWSQPPTSGEPASQGLNANRAPIRFFTPASRTCQHCGGQVAADGYCQVCGAKAPEPSDHVQLQPAAWVGGVCDRGRVHTINEDAMAGAASPTQGEWAALVVCDGVSSAANSQRAATSAALSVVQILQAARKDYEDIVSAGDALNRVALAAANAANEAVVASSDEGMDNPPSCTLAFAAISAGAVFAVSVGDSRVYWVPEAGAAKLLTVDDSLSQEQMKAGVPREEAEASPSAHVITRWLGLDAPEIEVEVGMLTPQPVAGWVVVCSDGLWNYASSPEDFADAVRSHANDSLVQHAGALVAWANEQGGSDNVTVVLARLEAAPDILDVPTTKLTRTAGGRR